jgi:integrase
MSRKKNAYSNKADWLADPLKAFDAFIVSEDYASTSARKRNTEYVPLKAGSLEVYRAMFANLHAWMQSKQLNLFSLDRAKLQVFLEATDEQGARQIRSEIAYRYVRMLERIYHHLQMHPNAASELVIDTMNSRSKLGENEGMVVLSVDETARFIAALPPESVSYRGAKPDAGWKHRRDRALQMTILGAGLTVHEAVHLQWSQYNLDDVAENGSVPIQLRRGNFTHTASLQAFAIPYLRTWDAERRKLAITGPYAFPSHFSDQNSLFGERKPLNVVSVYRQIANTFQRARLEHIHVGGRNLRNTFAVRLLEQGASREELQESLGLALSRSVERYVEETSKLKAS